MASLAVVLPAEAQIPHGSTMTGSVVEGEDFVVYEGDGDVASFAGILAELDGSEAVLVGESHDDAVGHAVEAQLLVRAAQRYGAMAAGTGERPVVLSLEMFERDVQYILDEYLAGLITEDQFLESARPWERYRSDYRPMVEFARAHGIPVVAANAPRRYVNRVTRLGPSSLGALSPAARRFLPELPYPGPSEAYRAEWDALMGRMMAPDEEAPPAGVESGPVPGDDGGDGDAGDAPPAGAEAAGVHATDSAGVHGTDSAPVHPEPPTRPMPPGHPLPPEHPPLDGTGPVSSTDEPASPHAAPPSSAPGGHGMTYALDAQALWDAAMGEAVVEVLERRPGAIVLHLSGAFHVARGTGIPERIEDYRPDTRTLTVVLRPVEDALAWEPEEHEGLADYVILTREPAEASPHGTGGGTGG